MQDIESGDPSIVEVRPEVVFIFELLRELTQGRIRIPRFQRPFVWRRDQMTDLLDSINRQYPIGSLLVWETDYPVATLDHLGPFSLPTASGGTVGYLLDGHQRLSTLAGALVPLDEAPPFDPKSSGEPGMWSMGWNLQARRFQHMPADASPDVMFNLNSLMDTVKFFAALDSMRQALHSDPELAASYVGDVTSLARSFQQYRVPVIRIKQTGLSEAVEIFARLNSKGQAMTADQMVSALMFRQDSRTKGFDLAQEIDLLSEDLAALYFGDIDRTTILRAILANLDEDIYKTDWTRMARDRREELLHRLEGGVKRTARSLRQAVEFLQSLGVMTGRILPYGLQLVLLSAFFDRCPNPSSAQEGTLSRWFWVSSFSAWFGGANTSRVNSLISEFRHSLATENGRVHLGSVDLTARSLPYPLSFDMRSARTRTTLLVELDHLRRSEGTASWEVAWRSISAMGPSSVAHIYWNLKSDLAGDPANRIIRPTTLSSRRSARGWVEERVAAGELPLLNAYAIDDEAVNAFKRNDSAAFIQSRRRRIIELERAFQAQVGVGASEQDTGEAPVDTE